MVTRSLNSFRLNFLHPCKHEQNKMKGAKIAKIEYYAPTNVVPVVDSAAVLNSHGAKKHPTSNPIPIADEIVTKEYRVFLQFHGSFGSFVGKT